jgi:hypothetical protein
MSDVTLPDRDTYTPHDIAVAVFGEARAFQGAKLVRDYLRATFPRKPEERNTSWIMSPGVARQTVAAMTTRVVTEVVMTDEERELLDLSDDA